MNIVDPQASSTAEVLFGLMEEEKIDINIDYRFINFCIRVNAEDNNIIKQWKLLGQSIHSAADTQALLHLFQNYCQPHLCFNCQVGYQVFRSKQLELF